MKIIILLFLICFSPTLYAEVQTENIAWEDESGNVRVTYYILGSDDTLNEVLFANGYKGGKLKEITDKALLNERADHLKFVGSSLVIDQAKKNQHAAEKAAKQAEKDAVLEKLRISRQELEALNAKV